MRREIGSEFWDVPLQKTENNIFPPDTQWFISGRSALTAIIRDIKSKRVVHTVAMPSWCCNTIIKPFVDAGIEVHFYPVIWQNELRQETDDKCDILFVADYFGYKSRMLYSHPCVIHDITHSLFSLKNIGEKYSFGSLRKWCGVKTGGYAFGVGPDFDGTDKEYVKLRKSAMRKKDLYISGKIEDKDYLNVYAEAEERLDKMVGVYHADLDDVKTVRYLDSDYIRTRRRDNSKILMEAFRDWLIFQDLNSDDCPLFVPVLIPRGKRDQLRRHLIKNEIYCPVHWPISDYHKLTEAERFIYENELSLVCDQRYSCQDMERLVDVVKAFEREEL